MYCRTCPLIGGPVALLRIVGEIKGLVSLTNGSPATVVQVVSFKTKPNYICLLPPKIRYTNITFPFSFFMSYIN